MLTRLARQCVGARTRAWPPPLRATAAATLVHDGKVLPGDARIPPKPQEPSMEECCGNGCPNCVWIEYWDKLTQYEEAVAKYKQQEGGGGDR